MLLLVMYIMKVSGVKTDKIWYRYLKKKKCVSQKESKSYRFGMT